MMRDLNKIEGLKIGRLICSMWGGYLKDDQNKPLLDWLESRGIDLDHCHTSGHASLPDLIQFREAMATAKVIPIHTEAGSSWPCQLGPTINAQDGVWIDV